MVEAVGIELLNKSTKSHAVTVLPTANQMNWSQMELSWFGTLELTYRTPKSICPIRRHIRSKSFLSEEPAPPSFRGTSIEKE
jgi:hypothetical protein